MIDLLIAAGVGALIAHARNQTFEGKIERLQEDFKSGNMNPQQANARYTGIIDEEHKKVKPKAVVVPQKIRESFENGLHPNDLLGKIDREYWRYIEYLYDHGDYNFAKAEKNRNKKKD